MGEGEGGEETEGEGRGQNVHYDFQTILGPERNVFRIAYVVSLIFQGQNHCFENTQIVIARSWFETSSSNLAIRQTFGYEK